MSERLEQWKAREKVRSDIGWAAALIGVFALLTFAVSALEYWSSDEPGYGRPSADVILLALIGVALAVCAVGLWNVRTWARWVTVFLFGCLSIGLILEQTAFGLGVSLLPVVYLLAPSTARRFAQAREFRRARREEQARAGAEVRPRAPGP